MNKLFFYCYISSNSGLFLVFGTFLDFDTSHVKVYRAAGFEPAWLSDNFKTSHVKVYRSCAFLALSILCNFKTSHVKVYLKPGTDVICRYAISKHLMLKFIRKCQQSTCFLQHFKTSHVKVYLQAHTARKTTMAHFKTSHVKVYLTFPLIGVFNRFISKHLMLKFIQQTAQ